MCRQGKFSDILLCSDIDDTLMNSRKEITETVRTAITYFQREGGHFTLATGRAVSGSAICLDSVTPDVPVICHNGATLYDVQAAKYIKTCPLDAGVLPVVEDVAALFPATCMEIYTESDIIFHSINDLVLEHIHNERMPDIRQDFHDITVPWIKVVFVQKPEETAALRTYLEKSGLEGRYHLVQSTPFYYEILPRHVNKGAMLLTLAESLGIPRERVVAVGDNENDLEMIEEAGTGVAMGNAISLLKRRAQIVTLDNDHNGVSHLITLLDQGKIIPVNKGKRRQ